MPNDIVLGTSKATTKKFRLILYLWAMNQKVQNVSKINKLVISECLYKDTVRERTNKF